MFEEFFHLRENPFALAPNPRFIFRSHEHTEALAHLRYWVENGEGFVLITGEVGTGKTTALFDLMGQLPNEWAVAFVANSTLSGAELLEEICRRFQVEIPAVASKPALLERLEQHLGVRSDQNLGSVLILDEAQNYENRLLEEVRLLSNLERPDGKLLQIALVGQPELERKLELPELRQLRQRIGIRYRLNPLTEDETVAYVHHRLSVAGGDAERIFPRESGVEVHRLTHGIPREINIVASQALISAFVQGALQVGPEHVRNVVLDFAWSSILGRGPLPPVSRKEAKPQGAEAESIPGGVARSPSPATPLAATPPAPVPAAPSPVAPPLVAPPPVPPPIAPTPSAAAPPPPEPSWVEARQEPQPAASAEIDRSPSGGDLRQRPPLEVVRGHGAPARLAEPPSPPPGLDRPIRRPGSPAASPTSTTGTRPEPGRGDTRRDEPRRGGEHGRDAARQESRRVESRRAARAEPYRGRIRWEDRQTREKERRGSTSTARSGEAAWIESLTDREPDETRSRAIGWWVLLGVVVLAGAIFLWSGRGSLPFLSGKAEKPAKPAAAERALPETPQASPQQPANVVPGNESKLSPSSSTRGGVNQEPGARGATSGAVAPQSPARPANPKLRGEAPASGSSGIGSAGRSTGAAVPANRVQGGQAGQSRRSSPASNSRAKNSPASSPPAKSSPATGLPPSSPPSETAPSGSPPQPSPVPPAPGPDAPRPRPAPYAGVDESRSSDIASAPAAVPSTGAYAIQIAAFQGSEDTVERAQIDYQRTYSDPIEIVPALVNAREWHRVCLGRYDSLNEAQAALTRFKAAGKIRTGVVRRLGGVPASD